MAKPCKIKHSQTLRLTVLLLSMCEWACVEQLGTCPSGDTHKNVQSNVVCGSKEEEEEEMKQLEPPL